MKSALSRFLFAILAFFLLNAPSLPAATKLYVSTYDESGEGVGNILKISDTGVSSVWNINWDNGQVLEDPEGLALDAHGNLFVNDGQFIYKIDPNGNGTTFATKPNVYYAYGLAIDGAGNIYAMGADGFDYAVYKFNDAGVEQGHFLIPGAYAMTFGSDGLLYISEDFNGTIGQYTTDGVRNGTYGTLPENAFPMGIAFDASGTLAVDFDDVSGSPVVTKIYQIGPGGTPSEQLSSFTAYTSFGLDVDDNGNVYIATKRSSFNNNRNRIEITIASGTSSVFSQLDNSQRPNFVVVVPEPAVCGLAAAGLCCLLWRRRRF